MDTEEKSAASKRDRQGGCCELCGRDVVLTFHHLIPCKVHRRKRFLRRHGKLAMQRRGLYLCRLCHNGIHDIIPDEQQLAESYNTRELLLAHVGIARHVRWAAKQKS
ncbi:MAG: hypothetical protein RIC55_31835 [Pirellulaceae bacterium]